MQRIPFLCREKAAMIKLRRVGLSINQISDFTGRSTSVVRRILRNAQKMGLIRNNSLRKLPYRGRMRMASYRRALLEKLRDRWNAWICGAEGEPP